MYVNRTDLIRAGDFLSTEIVVTEVHVQIYGMIAAECKFMNYGAECTCMNLFGDVKLRLLQSSSQPESSKT